MHILVSVPQGKKCTRKGKRSLLILIKIDNFILRIVRDASACYPTCAVYISSFVGIPVQIFYHQEDL